MAMMDRLGEDRGQSLLQAVVGFGAGIGAALRRMATPHEAVGYQRLGAVPTLADDLFDKAERLQGGDDFDLVSPKVRGRDILIVADRTRGLWNRAGVFDGIARSVSRSPELREVLAGRNESLDRRSVLVIDIDSFESLQEAVRALHSFRRRRPEIPVLIASATLARNDFSTERCSIADASLRLPCTSVSLALGVGAAVANNALQIHNR